MVKKKEGMLRQNLHELTNEMDNIKEIYKQNGGTNNSVNMMNESIIHELESKVKTL